MGRLAPLGFEVFLLSALLATLATANVAYPALPSCANDEFQIYTAQDAVQFWIACEEQLQGGGTQISASTFGGCMDGCAAGSYEGAVWTTNSNCYCKATYGFTDHDAGTSMGVEMLPANDTNYYCGGPGDSGTIQNGFYAVGQATTKRYIIECSALRPGYNIAGSTATLSDFRQCVQACDTNANTGGACVGVEYHKDTQACTFKSGKLLL